MKIKSLMFQEFKLAKKFIVLQTALLLAWAALTWGMLLSAASEGLTQGELYQIIDAVAVITALIGAMPLLMDDNLKSNINSGWLNYSYTLPVSPLERTAARFVRRAASVFVNALLSLCSTAALCANMGKPFGVNYVVWHIIVIAAVIMSALPDNIFILRSRNAADMKKMQTVSGMIKLAIMIITVVIIYKASSMNLEKLMDSETAVRLPVFTAGALAWAVPLLLAMMAAGFFAAYHSLKSAYTGAIKSEKENAEIKPQDALPAKTDGVNGLLYKELRQNKLMLILAAIAPILLTAFPFCFSVMLVIAGSADVNELFETATNVFMRMLMYTIGIFAVSGLMSEVFKGDDKKLWAYFIVSTPQGAKGFIYRKYVVTIMMSIIYMVSCVFADNLLATVNYFVTGKELTTSMTALNISGVFLLMAISAFDIPFTVRYGSKKGSMVKMVTMLSLCTVSTVIFSLLPDTVQAKLIETVTSVLEGGANDVLMLILSLFPFIALTLFLYSYKIACRVFMKGVNEYDK